LKRIALAAAALGLSACGPQMAWVKPGAAPQDFTTDSYLCEKDMRQSGDFGGGLGGLLEAGAFEGRCMNAHGWTQAPVPAGAARP